MFKIPADMVKTYPCDTLDMVSDKSIPGDADWPEGWKSGHTESQALGGDWAPSGKNKKK